jgi:phage gpG-like protein
VSGARVDWDGDGAIAHVRSAAARALTRAAVEVTRRARELLSVPGTAQGRDAGTGRYRRVYGAAPSAPGEPPRKQTGRLRASVTYEVDDASLTARVGTNVEYGKYLELGTKRGIAPRPWLRRALAECRARIEQILSQAGGTP